MEDNIETIIVVIISVFLLFIFPVYMAYEKKDDISYALAMRYTQDLVDEVRNKGYITKNMYEDYKIKLRTTGNSYDIQLTHEYNRYDPIINYYKVKDGNYTLIKTSTKEQKEEYELLLVNDAISIGKLSEKSSNEDKAKYIKEQYIKDGVDKIEETYQLSKQVYTTEHIINVLNSERKLLLNSREETINCSDSDDFEDGCQYAYIMNVDDNFNITIKNTNITFATIIYNMVTANKLDVNTRIYVNYGGYINSSKWYDNIDYVKMDHENITLNKFISSIIFNEERVYSSDIRPIASLYKDGYNKDYNNEYAIEFEVKPKATTPLKEKGNNSSIKFYTLYNFALGNSDRNNKDISLSASIGINGVSLITHSSKTIKAITTKSIKLPTYIKAYITRYDNKGNKIGYEEQIGQKTINSYKKIEFKYFEKGRVQVILTGKNYSGIMTEYIILEDEDNLLEGLNYTIEDPKDGEISINLKDETIGNGNITCKIKMENSNISISAEKNSSSETTILSYPITIQEYVKIKIEVKKNNNKKYVATLYIDGERIEESIEMDYIPKVESVGKTLIRGEERYFNGNIRNVKIYYYSKEVEK